jgi:threonine dehydratase
MPARMTSAPTGTSRAALVSTEAVIRPHIRRTPVISLSGDDFGIDVESLSFKLEFMQHAGSFKTRGAFANLLTRSIPESGVVAASGGNHGAAVAYAAKVLGVPATIFVPDISSAAKIDCIRGYGADLIVGGQGYAEALAASELWQAQSHALPVHAFDQNETICGQASLAIELEEQCSALDTVLVSVGGGGLIAGVAAWYERKVKVIGVEPAASPTLADALAAGKPVDARTGGLAADSLSPRRVGERVFPVIRDNVERVVLVDDDAIRDAQKTLWKQLRVVGELGGSAAFAALLSGAYRAAPGERVGVIISGGNTTAVDFDR